MRYLNYIKIFCKRLLTKPLYIIIILLIPILAFSVKHFSNKEDTSLNIAIYNEGNDELSEGMTNYLLELNGTVHFYECDNADEVYDRVKHRKSDSGFIIPADLSERMEKDVTLGAVKCVISPGSTMPSVAKEFVITAFIQTYAFDILRDYTINSGDFSDMSNEDIEKELREYYNKYITSDDTFKFNFKNDYIKAESISLVPDLLISSTSGIFAVFIFITALAGTIMLYKDYSDGVFVLYKPFRRSILAYIDICVPTFICLIVVMFGTLIGAFSDNIIIDSIRGLGFVLLCSGLCLILKNIIPSATIFGSALPVFLIGSMLFCPVFIDISIFIPKLTTLKYLFPVTYYLNCDNYLYSTILLLCGIVCSILSILITYRMEKYNNGL